MKLLNKTIIYYLLFALPVFMVCSVLIYYLISNEIKDELDENLLKQKTETVEKIERGIPPGMIASRDLLISSYPQGPLPADTYTDTSMYNTEDDEVLPYRILGTYANTGGQNYALTIRNSYVESDDLLSGILIPIISMFVLLLTGFLFINYWISKKLWNPFYKTIGQLKTFELGSSGPFFFPDESIREFRELNRSLNLMTQKAYKDYLRQKEFTENASHEIQTPLAIIQNKIELLIQSKQLGEEEMKLISGIYDSAVRLSHLNKTLLLLTKIENKQFTAGDRINPGTILRKCIDNYMEQAAGKNISVSAVIDETASLQMNPALCDTLFSNLLMNAIRHNATDGMISLQLRPGFFTITNTGDPLSIPSGQLFERFKKGTSSIESTGLGLSIVQSICTLHGISVSHSYAVGKHTFTLAWQHS
jgi:signal transduction histidine kinase